MPGVRTRRGWQAAGAAALIGAAAVGTYFMMREKAAVAPCPVAFAPPPIFDTSAQQDDPWVRRAMGLAHWTGDWGLVNMGNELQFVRFSERRLYASSNWRVPPFGDRDYNLFNFHLCDGCTVGVAGFQSMGTVVFSVQVLGGVPSWGRHYRYVGVNNLGGFTYTHGGWQYLMANQLTGRCQGAELLIAEGVEPGEMTFVQCVEDANGEPIGVDGGVFIPGSPAWAYIVSGTRVHLLRVTASGVEYQGQPMRAGWVRGAGIALDLDRMLLATTSPISTQLWSVADPGHPALHADWSPHPTIDMDTVAIHWPYLWTASFGGTAGPMTHTFNIGDTSSPVECCGDLWATDAPAQSYANAGNMAAVWHDGELAVARWSVLEWFDAMPSDAIFADGFESGGTGAWGS